MGDYRLPAPLVGMLKHTKITGMPVVQTDLQATKLSVTIIWDLATSAPKKSKKQPAKKKPSKPSAPSTTAKPPTSKPAKKTPTPTRQPTPPPPKSPQRPTPATPRQPTPTSSPRRQPPTVPTSSPQRSPPKPTPMQTEPPANVQPSEIPTRSPIEVNSTGKTFRHFRHKGYTIRTSYDDHDRTIFEMIHPTDADPHYLQCMKDQEYQEVSLEMFKNPDSKYYAHEWYSSIKTKCATQLSEITDRDVISGFIKMLSNCLIYRVEPATDAT